MLKVFLPLCSGVSDRSPSECFFSSKSREISGKEFSPHEKVKLAVTFQVCVVIICHEGRNSRIKQVAISHWSFSQQLYFEKSMLRLLVFGTHTHAHNIVSF